LVTEGAHLRPGLASSAGNLGIGFNEAGAVLFAGLVLVAGAVLWAQSAERPAKTDFSVTYVGARIVHQGHGAQLYDLDEQATQKRELGWPPNLLVYEHPPFEALLFSPLAALPYRTAHLVWMLVNAAIWLTLPFLLRPYLPAPREPFVYLALWFLFVPLGVTLTQGQSSLAVLGFYALCYTSLRRGGDVEAGALLGLALLKFQLVLPFALIFLLRRKWGFMAGFSVSAVLLGVLSVVAVGWSGILSYARLLLSIAGHPQSSAYGAAIGIATVQGFSNAVLDGRLPQPLISLMVAAVSFFLIGFTAWRWRLAERKRPDADFDLMFAAAIAVALMTGFHMFMHDLSPLALSMFLVMAHLPPRGALRWVLGSTMTLFWIPVIYFVLLGAGYIYLLFLPLAAFGLATLSLEAGGRGSGVRELQEQ
jgi:Glycosyltransferase family 87